MSTHREREKNRRYYGQARPGGDYRITGSAVSSAARPTTRNERMRFLNYQGRTVPGGDAHQPETVIASEKRRFVRERIEKRRLKKAERAAAIEKAAEQAASSRLRRLRSMVVFGAVAAASLLMLTESPRAIHDVADPSKQAEIVKPEEFLNTGPGIIITGESTVSTPLSRVINRLYVTPLRTSEKTFENTADKPSLVFVHDRFSSHILVIEKSGQLPIP